MAAASARAVVLVLRARFPRNLVFMFAVRIVLVPEPFLSTRALTLVAILEWDALMRNGPISVCDYDYTFDFIWWSVVDEP